jgi:hypothetical protein
MLVWGLAEDHLQVPRTQIWDQTLIRIKRKLSTLVSHPLIIFAFLAFNYELQIPLLLTTRTKYHSQRAKFLISSTNKGNGGKRRKQMGQ